MLTWSALWICLFTEPISSFAWLSAASLGNTGPCCRITSSRLLACLNARGPCLSPPLLFVAGHSKQLRSCQVHATAAKSIRQPALPLAQRALPACYPPLEAYINGHLLSGHLREAKVHRERPLHVPCLYWSTTSRFCPAVGREHASNHMQIVVNVAYCTWRFHCLDPECQPGAWMSFSPRCIQMLRT